jgi:hypothetical protein
MEEPPRSTNYPDEYSLGQYLVDRPDPELRPFFIYQTSNLYVKEPRIDGPKISCPISTGKAWRSKSSTTIS